LLSEFWLLLQVNYKWESLDGWSAIPADGVAAKDLVLPPPVPAEAGHTYGLRLTASFQGAASSAATADVALTAVASPLVVSLVGPSGDTTAASVVLDASNSFDPDDPSTPLSFSWACVREDYPRPCFTGTNTGNMLNGGSRWAHDGILLRLLVQHKQADRRAVANASSRRRFAV
jgi:hypothetical protein